jgi:hypothetical protein
MVLKSVFFETFRVMVEIRCEIEAGFERAVMDRFGPWGFSEGPSGLREEGFIGG